MKLIKLIFAMSVGVFVSWTMTSCENQDNEFPDYEGGTSVYFATQYPVRTLVMVKMSMIRRWTMLINVRLMLLWAVFMLIRRISR